MADIRIRRTHQLGLENARTRVEAFAQSLKEELQIDYEWSDNRLLFKRTGASGTLEIGADAVALDIMLSMPLSLGANAIEREINERLDDALA